ncbi:MAG: transglycosylase domain-containing protein, partial [Hyphomicrobiaceae bacterium]
TSSPDYFLDWAYEEIQRVMEGKGSFVVTARTTLDPKLQEAADHAMDTTLRELNGNRRGRNVTSGALVAMEPDGAVRALVGGSDYGESQFNRATHARRQPGSSFKLYVYALTLEHFAHYTPRTMVRDASQGCGNWSPRNYDGGGGSGRQLALGDAFKVSLNTTATDLSLKAGRDNLLEMTRRLGVTGVKKTCSMALGDTGISPLEHTGAFAHFANGGKKTRPYAILEVKAQKAIDRRIEEAVVYSRETDEPEPPQVLSRRVVEYMNQMMQLVVTEGTGKGAALDFTHVVGKTGTSSSWRDAWFVGFTGALVAGVWLGNDDFRPLSKPGGGGITGGSFPATAWQRFMSQAHPDKNFPTIPGLSVHPVQASEAQRVAEARKNDPTFAGAGSPTRKGGIMPDRTREVLKQLSVMLRTTGGPGGSGGTPDPGGPGSPPAARPDKRADKSGSNPSGGLLFPLRGRP